MIKEIVRDKEILSKSSEPATKADMQTVRDLLDTVKANEERCVGMAANMIGVPKCIIVFYDDKKIVTMFNPEIVQKNQPYETEEGCLSLLGGPRFVTRYKSIKVRYQDKYMKCHEKRYSGFAAQIIQHEVDHCCGILI
jgi:peptide deformylase